MKEKFVNYNINKFLQTKKRSKSDIRIYKYGLESFYTLVTKLGVVFIISLIIETFKETFYLVIFYTILRSFSFGIHASNNINCWISTLTIYIFFPLIIKYCTFNNFIVYLLTIIFGLIICLFSPADTPKRPLIRKNKRIINKIISSIIVCLFILISFFSKNLTINNVIFVAILIQAVCVNPLTYKIAKIKYNNYKYYNNKMV